MRNMWKTILFAVGIGITGCFSPRIHPLSDANTSQASFQRDFTTAADVQERRRLFNSVKWIGKTETEVLALIGQPDMGWDPSADGSRVYGWGRWFQSEDSKAMWYLTLTMRNGCVVASNDEGVDP
jgi:hypothetical protein